MRGASHLSSTLFCSSVLCPIILSRKSYEVLFDCLDSIHARVTERERVCERKWARRKRKNLIEGKAGILTKKWPESSYYDYDHVHVHPHFKVENKKLQTQSNLSSFLDLNLIAIFIFMFCIFSTPSYFLQFGSPLFLN